MGRVRQDPVRSDLSYAVLGMLSFGRELTGYELKQWAENLRFFYAAPAMSLVYTELARLEDAELVTSREVPGAGRRSARVYRLAPAGEAELRAWLARPVPPPTLRHPVALRLFFGHLGDPDRLRALLEEHRARCEELLAQLDAIRAELGDDPTFRYPALVAQWGQRYYRGEADAATDTAGLLPPVTRSLRPGHDDPAPAPRPPAAVRPSTVSGRPGRPRSSGNTPP